MPKRSNDFQALVYTIQQQMTENATVTESKMLVDRQTKSEAEVDIVIEITINDYPVTISIEVRDRKRPATVEWVREMIGKHSTLCTNKLILVSKSGFTKEALLKAQESHVETITYDDVKLFDWSRDIKSIIGKEGLFVAAFDMQTIQLKVNFVEAIEKSVDEVNKFVTPDSIFNNPSLSESAPVNSIPTAILKNNNVAIPIMNRWIKEGKDEFTITWSPPEGSYIHGNDENDYLVRSIELKGKCIVRRVPVKFEHGAIKNTQVAHAKIPNIFQLGNNSGEVSISLIEQENKSTGVISIPNEKGKGVITRTMKYIAAEDDENKT